MSSKTPHIVAIIPARSGSKGVPDKNIRSLSGHPLIAYSIKAAQKSSMVDRVIVSTDSIRYAKIAKSYGADVPFIRPLELSQDTSGDIDFFLHAIDWLIANEGFAPDYFVHLRPTTPLRDPILIDEAIEMFLKKDYTALRSVHPMSESAYKTFEIDDSILLRAFTHDSSLDSANHGRQTYPKTYDANGYIDIVRTDQIINKKLLHGDRVFAYVTPHTYEIDEESDIPFIEWVIEKNNQIYSRLFR